MQPLDTVLAGTAENIRLKEMLFFPRTVFSQLVRTDLY